MNKVDGTLQQTDTNHAQAKIYDANKQLVKEGLQTQGPGQFMAVSDEDAQTRKGLMDNGVVKAVNGVSFDIPQGSTDRKSVV